MSFYRRFPYTTLNDINLDWIIKKVKALIGVVDEKQDKPASAGTAGQVLGLDENLDPVWLDQTGGGGGGTTNYNNLSNKPQIESVTLSGNKTAADLGLARASDVPTKTSDLTNDSGFVNASEAAAAAPVQSVNGLSGGVYIAVPSASSTLPQMDGVASAGSNFSQFARGDHRHPTDTSRASAESVLQAAVKTISANGTSSNTLTGLTANHVVGNWGMFSDAACTTPIPENAPTCDITITTAADAWSVTIANFTSTFYLRPTFVLKQN